MSGSSVAASSYATVWDLLVGKYFNAISRGGATLDPSHFLLGTLSESGSPPGASGAALLYPNTIDSDPNINAIYEFYGWSKTVGGTPSRCSLGILQAMKKDATPSTYEFCTFGAPPIDLDTVTTLTIGSRPVGYAFFSKMLNIVIANVHLPSGKSCRSLNIVILQRLTSWLNAQWAVPIILVGDMNIDILGMLDAEVRTELSTLKKPAYPATTIATWNLLRTGEITQRSGGELDWGLACGCVPAAQIIGGLIIDEDTRTSKGYGYIAQGVSDHAMLGYFVDI